MVLVSTIHQYVPLLLPKQDLTADTTSFDLAAGTVRMLEA